MNGAVLDTTFNFFFKFKYAHTFDAMLATPLRVRDVALRRDDVGAAAGRALLGRVPRRWRSSGWCTRGGRCWRCPRACSSPPRSPAPGIAGTTFMRSWIDFDFVNLALIPMFLFSGVFFPLSQYPDAVQVIVQVTPLYQGVVLIRGADRRGRRAASCSSTWRTCSSWA